MPQIQATAAHFKLALGNLNVKEFKLNSNMLKLLLSPLQQ